MNKILSIVIPCFNKYNFTKSCLKDLNKLPNDHEIIIVDNGSNDETKLLKDSNEIKYLRLEENKGFAKACNYGYKESSASNVLFLNNDIRVKENHSNWTKPLLEKCNSSLCGPTMGLLNDYLEFVTESNLILPGKSYLSGWCLASSKEIFNKLNLSKNSDPQIFSEEFFCYFEDTDLSFRAKKLNIKLEVVKIPVVHFGKQTSSQLNTYMLYKKARQIFVDKWQKK